MSARPGRRTTELTARELDVLRGVAAGKTNAEIASDSFHSPETIKNHMRSVCFRLGAKNRAQAVALAFEKGILP